MIVSKEDVEAEDQAVADLVQATEHASIAIAGLFARG